MRPVCIRKRRQGNKGVADPGKRMAEMREPAGPDRLGTDVKSEGRKRIQKLQVLIRRKTNWSHEMTVDKMMKL